MRCSASPGAHQGEVHPPQTTAWESGSNAVIFLNFTCNSVHLHFGVFGAICHFLGGERPTSGPCPNNFLLGVAPLPRTNASASLSCNVLLFIFMHLNLIRIVLKLRPMWIAWVTSNWAMSDVGHERWSNVISDVTMIPGIYLASPWCAREEVNTAYF